VADIPRDGGAEWLQREAEELIHAEAAANGAAYVCGLRVLGWTGLAGAIVAAAIAWRWAHG
jgi:hypothetical protein